MTPAPLVLGVALWVGAGGQDGSPTAKTDPAQPGHAYGATPRAFVPYGKTRQPYRRFFEEDLVYRGLGRALPAPTDVTSVRVGLFVALSGPTAPSGRSLKRGVDLALEHANAAGGYRDLPFELVTREDVPLWGSGANTLVQFAYTDRVWAVIGSLGSESSHVALRVALKVEVPMVNVGAGDPTLTETGLPWMVRITSDDRQACYSMARYLFQDLGLERVAVLRASDRDGRFGVREFRDAARRLSRPIALELQFEHNSEDDQRQLERLRTADAQAVVLWGGPEMAARVVRKIRRNHPGLLVVGNQQLVSERFLTLAGEAAEGVVATLLGPTTGSEASRRFRRQFQARFGKPPNALSAYGYDAGMMVVESIRRAGLNRALIRDALGAVRHREGVAGPIHLDATSNSVLPPALHRVVGGAFVPL